MKGSISLVMENIQINWGSNQLLYHGHGIKQLAKLVIFLNQQEFVWDKAHDIPLVK